MSEKKIYEKRKRTKGRKTKILLNIDYPLDLSVFYKTIDDNNQIKLTAYLDPVPFHVKMISSPSGNIKSKLVE